MCRNLRVLHHFAPPTIPDEIRAAALQYGGKVSGLRAPAKTDVEAVDRAVAAITEATIRLLAELPSWGEARTGEGQLEKARAKWRARAART